MYKNLQSVLGPNPLLWLWPREMHGDGLSFPVNAEAAGESHAGAVDWAGHVFAARQDDDVPRHRNAEGALREVGERLRMARRRSGDALLDDMV